MIGILVNTWMYRRMLNCIDIFENIEFYRIFSKEHLVPLCLYCMQGITPGQPQIEGLVIETAFDTLSKQKILWPKDNFCRAVLSKGNVKILEQCSRKYNLSIYQLVSVKERNKFKHIDYLRQNSL